MYNSEYVFGNTGTNKNAYPYPKGKETSTSHRYSERQWLGLDKENAVMVCLFSQYGTLRGKKKKQRANKKAPKGKTNSREHEEKPKQKMRLLHLVKQLRFKRRI